MEGYGLSNRKSAKGSSPASSYRSGAASGRREEAAETISNRRRSSRDSSINCIVRWIASCVSAISCEYCARARLPHRSSRQRGSRGLILGELGFASLGMKPPVCRPVPEHLWLACAGTPATRRNYSSNDGQLRIERTRSELVSGTVGLGAVTARRPRNRELPRVFPDASRPAEATKTFRLATTGTILALPPVFGHDPAGAEKSCVSGVASSLSARLEDASTAKSQSSPPGKARLRPEEQSLDQRGQCSYYVLKAAAENGLVRSTRTRPDLGRRRPLAASKVAQRRKVNSEMSVIGRTAPHGVHEEILKRSAGASYVLLDCFPRRPGLGQPRNDPGGRSPRRRRSSLPHGILN
jgi:hypothetical protein